MTLNQKTDIVHCVLACCTGVDLKKKERLSGGGAEWREQEEKESFYSTVELLILKPDTTHAHKHTHSVTSHLTNTHKLGFLSLVGLFDMMHFLNRYGEFHGISNKSLWDVVAELSL